MRSIIPTPAFVLQKRLMIPLEIDMYAIEGQYAEGGWHNLIESAIKNWARNNQFQGRGTLWYRRGYSVNFGHQDSSFFITAFGLPKFISFLENYLSPIRRHVRRSDETKITRGQWFPYLHLEQGKIWSLLDAGEWIELE